METPEDVDGVLELCNVLIKDQTDSTLASGGAQTTNPTNTNAVTGVGLAVAQHIQPSRDLRRQGPHFMEREEMTEEQGWVARMVHLFRAESLAVQFEVR